MTQTPYMNLLSVCGGCRIIARAAAIPHASATMGEAPAALQGHIMPDSVIQISHVTCTAKGNI
jgi:hypothetical protein